MINFEPLKRKNYDGYHFHPRGEGMFNPFSVLNAFSNMELGSYWFQTGTPTFLVEMLQKTEYDLRTLLDGIEAPASVFSEYRVDSNNPNSADLSERLSDNKGV